MNAALAPMKRQGRSDFQAICGCCALEPASGEAAGVIHHGHTVLLSGSTP